MTVVMHHQPVLNFHTGLVAKVAEASRRGGVFLIHDLDTLKESGSDLLRVPKPRGPGLGSIRLVEKRLPRKLLFTAGPVMIEGVEQIDHAVTSLADGKISGDFPERVEEFMTCFPNGSHFGSIAELNLRILECVLPKIGVVMPRVERLSRWLGKAVWKEASLRFLDYYEDFELLWQKRGAGRGKMPFWRWDSPNHRRHQVDSLDEARGLATEGLLIPKAIPLVWIVRVELGCPMIRGAGGAEYERPLEEVAGKLKKRIAPTTTVTSQQGVPEKWKPAVRDKNFRPSALLLWLLGGEFEHHRIIAR